MNQSPAMNLLSNEEIVLMLSDDSSFRLPHQARDALVRMASARMAINEQIRTEHAPELKTAAADATANPRKGVSQ